MDINWMKVLQKDAKINARKQRTEKLKVMDVNKEHGWITLLYIDETTRIATSIHYKHFPEYPEYPYIGNVYNVELSLARVIKITRQEKIK